MLQKEHPDCDTTDFGLESWGPQKIDVICKTCRKKYEQLYASDTDIVGASRALPKAEKVKTVKPPSKKRKEID